MPPLTVWDQANALHTELCQLGSIVIPFRGRTTASHIQSIRSISVSWCLCSVYLPRGETYNIVFFSFTSPHYFFFKYFWDKNMMFWQFTDVPLCAPVAETWPHTPGLLMSLKHSSVSSGIRTYVAHVVDLRWGAVTEHNDLKCVLWFIYLPTANEVWGKVIFLHQFVILFTGGAWFYSGGEGCMVLFRGACMVLFGGHAWLYLGGMHGFIGGHAWFYSGGVHGFIQGACMVLFGGHVWFDLGGMRGFIWGACMVFFSFFRCNEIRSMSGRYASYWNAFLW